MSKNKETTVLRQLFLFFLLAMSDTDMYERFAVLAMSNLVSMDDLLLLLAAHTADKLTEEKPHDVYEKFDRQFLQCAV